MRVPYFDDADLEYEDDGDGSEKAEQALAAFLALTREDRLRDSRHVYAYYRDYREAVGGEDWMDEEMGVPSSPEDIWTYVQPMSFWLVEEDGIWFISCECNCGWEIEHGLQLAWKEGKQLTKVGGFDGHVTNWEVDEDVVYASLDPAYMTRL